MVARHELLAGEIRTLELVMGSAGGKRRQGRSLDRRAQFHRAAESREYEERRPRLFLSFQRRQGDCRDRGSHQGGLSRSDRQDQQVCLRRPESRQAVENAGDDGRDQGRQAVERNGAGEVFAAVGSAGDGGGMETRLQNGPDAVTILILRMRGSAVSKDGRIGASWFETPLRGSSP